MSNYKLDLYDGELYHYGTKGQKWGVRRYQNKDGSLTPEGYIHYGRRAQTSNRTGKVLSGLGSIAGGIAAVSYGSRQYTNAKKIKEASTNVKNIAEVLNTNRQKLQKINAIPGTLGGRPAYLTKKAKALGRQVSIGTSNLNKATANKEAVIAAAQAASILSTAEKAALVAGGAAVLVGLGYLGYSAYSKAKIRKSAAIEDARDSVQHSAILDMSSGELYHWGILGMKWGVRRYQNKDGSLTPEGQLRYNRKMSKLDQKKLKIDKKIKKMEQRDAKVKAKIEVKKEKKLKKAKRKDTLGNALGEVAAKKIREKAGIKKEDKEDKKEKAAKKVASLTSKLDNKSKSSLGYKDFQNVIDIVEYGEKRTHNGLDRIYRDKYVLDGQTKLKTKKFKQMSTQELNDYINRYSAETRYLNEKEKRSSYDRHSRTLKRVASHVGTVITIAVGVKVIKSILDKDYT